MKKLYRLVSPNNLEIYNINSTGRIHLHKSVDPLGFNFKKIQNLILSSYFTNWDTTLIENSAYKPNSGINMFASQSIYESDSIFITAPFQEKNTEYWAQAWAPKNKLNPYLKNISKNIKIHPEALTIFEPTGNLYWISGPLILNFSKRSGFVEVNIPEEFTKTIKENLNDLYFKPRTEFSIFKKKKSIYVFLALSFLAFSLVFTWNHSLNNFIKQKNNSNITFDNAISGLALLNIIQSSIPDGMIEKIKFNQKTESTVYTFYSITEALNFFNIASKYSNTLIEWSISMDENLVTFTKKRAE